MVKASWTAPDPPDPLPSELRRTRCNLTRFGGLFLAKSNWRDLKEPCAVSWLSLARQDEAMDNLLASWDTPESVKTDGPGAYSRSTKLCFTEPAYTMAGTEREGRAAPIRAIS